jgi:hypothetical protein
VKGGGYPAINRPGEKKLSRQAPSSVPTGKAELLTGDSVR